ncbi:hypothetical protein LTR64_006107 [Lithohypha guttulata]|uniref:uncharacterized protein n=1 Tax=Lithohypha guttulata TaxID=1690604 RepID=UPI002DE122B6|nr:hypothetical protein LTR51_002095 [Lithohypha guttulata]
MSSQDPSPARTSEQTPLLSRTDSNTEYEANGHIEEDRASTSSPKKRRTQWPVIAAIGLLSVFMVLALIFGFATPSAVEQYVKEAVQFEADNISIENFTNTGIQARVQATVWLDASKVRRKSTRDLGRFATYIAKEVESGETQVKVYLPGYDNALLGTARIPGVKMNIRNGHYNWIDIVTDLDPGDPAGIQRLARDFMDHKLNKVDVKAIVDVPVKTGLISMNQQVTQYMSLETSDVPDTPKPELQSLRVAEYHGREGTPGGIKAWAKLSVKNEYPVRLTVPPTTFDVLLADCEDDYLHFATTTNEKIEIIPKHNISVAAEGLMTRLPTSLTTACPGSSKSPLDTFIASYMRGQDATVYIRGGKQGPETPEWIGKLLRDTIIPVPLPARPFDDMIKNFTLSDVHFSLPESPTGRPVLSATVGVLVALPKDMNFDVDVSRVRADGAIYYEGEEMGKLDLSTWQESRSHKQGGDLLVESKVIDAPLVITNEDVFAKVVQKMAIKHESVAMGVQAVVDVDATTALGSFVVSGIPSKGKILVDPPKTGGFTHEVGKISVVDTTPNKLTMKAEVTITNPTDYYANMPRVDAALFVNGTRMGTAYGGGNIVPGKNDIVSYVEWEKTAVGAEFLSQFISGYNVSLTIKPMKLPGLPEIPMNITVEVPHMFGKFLKDTTIHILSQTATFVLFAPIAMWVTSIHSTAYYNGSDIGNINWEYPFAVKPGDNLTPRLPLDWNTPGSGLIRDALGGNLKITALADIGVRIGQWRQDIWYEARDTGAHIRL